MCIHLMQHQNALDFGKSAAVAYVLRLYFYNETLFINSIKNQQGLDRTEQENKK